LKGGVESEVIFMRGRGVGGRRISEVWTWKIGKWAPGIIGQPQARPETPNKKGRGGKK